MQGTYLKTEAERLSIPTHLAPHLHHYDTKDPRFETLLDELAPNTDSGSLNI